MMCLWFFFNFSLSNQETGQQKKLIEELERKKKELLELSEYYANLDCDDNISYQKVPIYMSGVDTTRMKAYINTHIKRFMQGIFNKISKEPINAPKNSFIVITPSPIIRYKAYHTSYARRIILKYDVSDPYQCKIRQYTLQLIGKASTEKTNDIDLDQNARSFIYDFQTEIEFSEIELDVVRNWGEEKFTCIPNIIIEGPLD